MQILSPIESLIKRDRAVVIVGVIAVSAIAWGYIIYVAQSNADMGMSMSVAAGNVRPWTGVDFALMFVMWSVMMVAMMVPSAAPMILLFATVNRRRREQDRPFVSTGVFLSGYLVIWALFALGATLGNWGLHQASLLSSMMGGSSSGYLGGGLLLTAGIFQWSRLKYVCLTHCRSPLSFLMSDWREGAAGALPEGESEDSRDDVPWIKALERIREAVKAGTPLSLDGAPGLERRGFPAGTLAESVRRVKQQVEGA